MDNKLSTGPTDDINSSGDLDFQQAAFDLDYSTYADVSSPSNSTIVDALCGQGNYLGGSDFVIAVVSDNGHEHFVVITGQRFNPATNLCDFTIADPASYPQNTFLSQYGGASEIRILTQ